ncbi:hypothetical protein OIV83_003999 [Microbotryomycetes sp. JL201]|nr:hypothetical protein OIV83_003999 [Microbotryomycetes sp. JL201]
MQLRSGRTRIKGESSSNECPARSRAAQGDTPTVSSLKRLNVGEDDVVKSNSSRLRVTPSHLHNSSPTLRPVLLPSVVHDWDAQGLERIDLSQHLNLAYNSTNGSLYTQGLSRSGATDSANNLSTLSKPASTDQAMSAPNPPPETPSRSSLSGTNVVEPTPVVAKSSQSSFSSNTVLDRAAVKQAIRGRTFVLPTIESWLESVGLDRQLVAIEQALNLDQRRQIRRQAPAFQAAASAESRVGAGEGVEPHWLEQLASTASCKLAYSNSTTESSQSNLCFVATPNRMLSRGAIESKRKLDAFLAFPCFEPKVQHKFEHVAIVLEFCTSKVGRLNVKAPQDKYAQCLGYMRDALVSQPLRTFVLGLCVFDELAAFVMLDREVVMVAYVDGCWTDNVVKFACLVNLLFTTPPSHAGLSPLATFKCDAERGLIPVRIPARLVDATLADTSLSTKSVVVLFKSSPASSPFSRATVALKLASPGSVAEQRVVVKVQNVDDNRKLREAQVWKAIDAYNRERETTWISSRDSIEVMAHLAAVERVFICDRFLKRHAPLAQTNFDRSKHHAVITRHQGVIVHLVKVIKKLFVVLHELWAAAGVLHRDISIGNVLHSQGQLVLTDWDCAWAKTLDNSSAERRQRTGTLDTMAIAVLKPADSRPRNSTPFNHDLLHDLESAVYVFLKIVWWHLRLSASPDESEFWNEVLLFDNPTVDTLTIAGQRALLWGDLESSQHLDEWLRNTSPELARVVSALLQQRPDQISRALQNQECRHAAVVDQLYAVLDPADLDLLDGQLKERWGKRTVHEK